MFYISIIEQSRIRRHMFTKTDCVFDDRNAVFESQSALKP